jgi:chromosome segregation ATPase
MLRPDEMDVPSTTPELRAQRLGSALRGLAAELVDERRKVAELRHQVAELEAQLESLSAERRDGAARRSAPRDR